MVTTEFIDVHLTDASILVAPFGFLLLNTSQFCDLL